MADLWPKDQAGQLKVASGVLAIIGAIAYYMYVYQPSAAELDTRQQRVEALEAANDRVKRELARGSAEQLRQQAQAYAQNLEVMRQLVPTGNEVPALLEQVSTAARRSGLDISTVEPQPVIVGEQFDTYRYKLSVFGSYHQVAEFLTNVGSLTRIVAPQNVTLAVTLDPAATKTRRRADQAVLDTDFEIQTYVSKVGAGPAMEDR
jgi:type IV pilus assembly protein PilO